MQVLQLAFCKYFILFRKFYWNIINAADSSVHSGCPYIKIVIRWGTLLKIRCFCFSCKILQSRVTIVFYETDDMIYSSTSRCHCWKLDAFCLKISLSWLTSRIKHCVWRSGTAISATAPKRRIWVFACIFVWSHRLLSCLEICNRFAALAR